MFSIRVVCLCLSVLAAMPARARDLPPAEYLLVGDVFPAVKLGIMVPVFAHVRTDGDRMDWTFFTYFSADALFCEQTGKCARFVSTLSHRVSWADDGTLRVMDRTLTTGEGLTIDRREIDGPHVYGAIDRLLAGGTLTLTDRGGQLRKTGRRGAARTVDLLPVSLDQALAALTFAGAFELSLARLDHCIIRQVAEFAADPAPTPAMTLVLEAMYYETELRRLRDLTYTQPYDPDAPPEVTEAEERLAVLQFAKTVPVKPAAEAIIDGAPLSDDALMALVAETTEHWAELDRPAMTAAIEDLATDWRPRVLAAIRIAARAAAVQFEGRDLQTAVCADITLGG